MKRWMVTIQVDTNDDKTWEDVEWAIRDLFVDDEHGNPNFTIGAVAVANTIEVSHDNKNDELGTQDVR